MTKDITSCVDSLEDFQDRQGVKVLGIFASVSGPDADGEYKIKINGDVYPRSGDTIPSDMKVMVTAYDDLGRVIGLETECISSDTFFQFETFSLYFFTLYEPERICLYVK